jgi:hypothetical protein
MNWIGSGFGVAFEVSFRELEHFVRRLHLWHATPNDPDQELPNVELSLGEQRAALHREVARRRQRETSR